MKLLFILNIKSNLKKINLDISNYDKICCIDGGLNTYLKYYKVTNNLLLFGDTDSIDKNILKINKIKTIKKNNQDETDTEFAIKYCFKNFKNITSIDFIGIYGGRFDHSLANIILFKKIKKSVDIKAFTENETIYFIQKNTTINNVINKTISIIPFTNVTALTLKNFKWELSNKNIKFGWITGISNIAIKDSVKISLKTGKLFVIVNNDKI